MTTIDIKLDGVSIVDDVLIADAKFTALADGQPGPCSITVKNDKGQYAPGDFVMGQTLELYIDGQREWDGWLFDFKRTWPFEVMDTSSPLQVPKYWKLRGFDRNLLFQKRFLYDQNDPDNENGLPEYAIGTTDKAALLDICANYVHLSGTGLSTSGIKEVISPSQGGKFILGYVGAPWGLAFDDCAKMSGAVFYIDPDRVIHYRGDTDVNAPWDLTDNPGDGDEGYAQFLWTDDFTDCATEAFVWGAGYGSKYPVLAHAESNIDTYGRWQWADIFVGAYKQATVNKRANTYLRGSPGHRRGHDEPVPVVTLTQYKPGMRCGMVANVISEIHEVSDSLPCRRLDITFPTPTSVKYDMEMTLKIDAPFSAPDLWRLQDWRDRSDDDPPSAPPGGTTTVEVGNALLLIDDFERGTAELDAYYTCGESYGPLFDGIYTPDWSMPYGPDAPWVTRHLAGGSKLSWLVNPSGWGEAEKVVADELGCYVSWQGGPGGNVIGDPYGTNYAWNGIRAYSKLGALRWEYRWPYYGAYSTSIGCGDGYIWSSEAGLTLLTNAGTPVIQHAPSVVTTLQGGTYFYATLGPLPQTLWVQTSNNKIALWNASGIVAGPWDIDPAVAADVGFTGFLIGVKDRTKFFTWSNNESGETSLWMGSSDGSTEPVWQQVVNMPADASIVGIDPLTEEVFAAGDYWAKGYKWTSLTSMAEKWSVSTTVVPSSNAWDSSPAGAGVFHVFGDVYASSKWNVGKVALSQEDGSVIDGTFAWGGDSTDGFVVNGGCVGAVYSEDALPPFKTPPVDPWEGGNSYYTNTSTLVPAHGWAEVVDGVLRRSDASALQVSLWDQSRVINPDDGPGGSVGDLYEGSNFVGQPAGGWSTRYWGDAEELSVDLEDGLDILIKWRYTGATPAANTCLRVEWEAGSIPVSGAKDDCWLQHVLFYIGGGFNGIQSQLNFFNLDKTPPANPAWPSADSFCYPYHAYDGGANFSIVEDQWYYTRVKVGEKTSEGWGYPYIAGGGSDYNDVGLNLSAVKTWPAEEEEPTDGTSQPFDWYWSYPSYSPGDPPPFPTGDITQTAENGWDLVLPSAWLLNWNQSLAADDSLEFARANRLRLASSYESPGKFEIDGIWKYGSGTVVVPSVTDDSVAEVPRFTGTNTLVVPGYSIYQTRYPYEPGSLIVHVDGSVQGPGDFYESDPATGEFYLYDPRDRTDAMYVTYTRASSQANYESDGVYRPAPVLQYGWGTRLDGDNCNMAAGCMALDRHTLGAKSSTSGNPLVTPPNMRSYQYDQSGGTDLLDLQTAWSNGWGETLVSPGVHSWSSFVAAINEGRGAVLQGLYGNLPASKRFSDTFTGGHSIYINEEISPGYFWGRDPLTSGAVVYSAAELQSYAVGLSWVGAGQVSAAYTQVTS